MASSDKQGLPRVAESIRSKVDIRIEEYVKKFLGIVIDYRRGNGSIKVRNSPMIGSIPQGFAMLNCRPPRSPMSVRQVLLKVNWKDSINAE